MITANDVLDGRNPNPKTEADWRPYIGSRICVQYRHGKDKHNKMPGYRLLDVRRDAACVKPPGHGKPEWTDLKNCSIWIKGMEQDRVIRERRGLSPANRIVSAIPEPLGETPMEAPTAQTDVAESAPPPPTEPAPPKLDPAGIVVWSTEQGGFLVSKHGSRAAFGFSFNPDINAPGVRVFMNTNCAQQWVSAQVKRKRMARRTSLYMTVAKARDFKGNSVQETIPAVVEPPVSAKGPAPTAAPVASPAPTPSPSKPAPIAMGEIARLNAAFERYAAAAREVGAAEAMAFQARAALAQAQIELDIAQRESQAIALLASQTCKGH